MLDAKKTSDFEQAAAGMREMFPQLWRQLYLGNIEQGFAPNESLELVKAYILSQCIYGINGAK